MSQPFSTQEPKREHTRWSWASFGAGIFVGIIVGIIGFFALVAILFSDDISTALDEEQAGSDQVAQVQELAAELTTCDAHDSVCHYGNYSRVTQIDAAMPDAPASLRNALASFETEHESFADLRCGVNKQNVMCGLAGMNMNVAVSTIKAEAGHL